MNKTLSIAVFQMTSVDDVDANLRQIESLIQKTDQPFEMGFFPENSLYMRIKEGEAIPGLTLQDPAFAKLAEFSRKRNAVLHLGSVPLKEQEKLTNSSVTIYPDGRIESTYRKMHLFDISLEGQRPIKESDVFHHGPSPSILEFDSWKLGQTICYDIRFAELYSYYAKKGVDVLLVPAAFLVKTGQAHWEILLRARAIESQCYVVAAAQAGVHKNSRGDERKTYGHSLVVNPWGDVIAQGASDRPEVLWLELDQTLIETVRRQIPMRDHRRL